MTTRVKFPRAAVLPALLLVSFGAAADWKLAYRADGYASYYDPATIHRDGDKARLFQLRDLKKPGVLTERVYRSQQAVLEYDCKASRVRMRALTLYAGPMATGDILESDISEEEWQPVAAGSMNEEFLRIACGTQK